MSLHSKFSPSGAHRWVPCPGSMILEAGYPRTSSAFADEGTAAHELAAQVLMTGAKSAKSYIGGSLIVGKRTFTIDEAMAEHVDNYVTAIYARKEALLLNGATTTELDIERRVDFSLYLDLPEGEAYGTADVMITAILPKGNVWLDINDLKYGQGVEVYADNNEQMMLYALGAIPRDTEVSRVIMSIHQPRRNHFSEWECSKDDLLSFAEKAKDSVQIIQFLEKDGGKDSPMLHRFLEPGEKQCRFCKASADCPALREEVAVQVFNDFAELDKLEAPSPPLVPDSAAWLGTALTAIPLIKVWVKAVEAKALEELQTGREVTGHKLVQGRDGNRKWADDVEAEATLKKLRLKKDEMYEQKIITPTAAAKLLEKEFPTKWKALQPLITRSEGGVTVAPMSDKRPAIEVSVAKDVFEDMSIDDLL